MSEETTKETSVSGNESVSDTNTDYIAAIKELKENSVKRSEYDALRAQNKELLNAIVNGQEVSQASDSNKVSVNDLREDLYGRNTDQMTNLEYVSKTLALRQAIIDSGKPDPFEAGNVGAKDSNCMVDGAKVASILQECVEQAEGDSKVFNMALQRHLRK